MADKKIVDLTALVTQATTDLYETSANGAGSFKETRAQQSNYWFAKGACAAASPASFNVAGTYYNGPANDGVGATLTLTAVGAFSLDGGVGIINKPYLLWQQTAQLENGIYNLTTVGDGATQAVLTRATNFNSSATIVAGAYTYIAGGSLNIGKTFGINPTNPISVGVDNIVFAYPNATLSIREASRSLNTYWIDFTSGNSMQGAIYPLEVITITSNTVLDETHWGKRILCNSATPFTVTFPQQSTLATLAGIWCELQNINSADITIAKEGAETLTGNTLLATNATAKVTRSTTTNWTVSGGTLVSVGMMSFSVGTVGNVAYAMAKMPGAGTIINNHSICRSGTCTATFAINATPVTATANAVSTSNQTQAVTAANTFVAGDYLNVTASANAACLDMNLNVEYTYRTNIGL